MVLPCTVTCCYVYEDEAYWLELKKHLSSLERIHVITLRTPVDIGLGREQRPESYYSLGDTDIVLLLMRPRFMSYNPLFTTELYKALDRHRQGVSRVLLLHLHQVNVQELAPLSGLPVLPTPPTPITLWRNTDEAFLSIVMGIYPIAQELQSHLSNRSYASPSWGRPPGEDAAAQNNGPGYSPHNFQSPQSSPSFHTTNTYNGPVIQGGTTGDVIGYQYITTINPGVVKDGARSLAQGARALWDGDYADAQKHLREAIEALQDDKSKAAQAYYFAALALLGGRLPRTQGNRITKSVESYMEKAIRLSPCASYYLIFARIKQDMVEHMGTLSNAEQEAYDFERKGRSLPPSGDDEENMRYFRRCQPRLANQL